MDCADTFRTQQKKSNQLSVPKRDECKTRKHESTAKQSKDLAQPPPPPPSNTTNGFFDNQSAHNEQNS